MPNSLQDLYYYMVSICTLCNKNQVGFTYIEKETQQNQKITSLIVITVNRHLFYPFTSKTNCDFYAPRKLTLKFYVLHCVAKSEPNVFVLKRWQNVLQNPLPCKEAGIWKCQLGRHLRKHNMHAFTQQNSIHTLAVTAWYLALQPRLS